MSDEYTRDGDGESRTGLGDSQTTEPSTTTADGITGQSHRGGGGRSGRGNRRGRAPTSTPRSADAERHARSRENSYRFRKAGAHFTYKGHIPFGFLLGHFANLAPGVARNTWHGQPPEDTDWNVYFNWYSVVHESSDAENSYDHTHFAFEWKNSVDRIGTAFRITVPSERTDTGDRIVQWPGCIGGESLNPNITNFSDERHKRRIFDEYHKKAPVDLLQSENSPSSAESLETRIKGARSLMEACNEAGVKIDSVTAVQLIRKDKNKAEPYRHLYPGTVWILKCDFKYNLYLWGPTNTGKTQWAAAQFERPLIVSAMDRLREFNKDEHDGIVFDDMSFKHLPRETQIHLLDYQTDRDIYCRYTNATIPAGTRKIFTSNKPFCEVFLNDPAIRRRCKKVKVEGNTYSNKRQVQDPDGGTHEEEVQDDDADFDSGCYICCRDGTILEAEEEADAGGEGGGSEQALDNYGHERPRLQSLGGGETVLRQMAAQDRRIRVGGGLGRNGMVGTGGSVGAGAGPGTGTSSRNVGLERGVEELELGHLTNDPNLDIDYLMSMIGDSAESLDNFFN